MRTPWLLVVIVSVTPVFAGEPVIITPQGPPRPVAVKPGYSVIEPRTGPTATLNRTTPGVATPKPLLVSAPQEPTPAAGNPEEGVLKLETWDVIFVRGVKAGYFHTVVREFDRDGRKLLYGVKRAKLTVARFGQVSEQWTEEATVETPEGQVLSTRLSQGIGKDQMLQVEGVVEGRKLKATISGIATDSTEVPFPEGVLGVAGEADLFPSRKPKPGEVIPYKSYLGGVNRVASFTAKIFAAAPLTIYEGQAPRPVLRAEVTAEKLEGYRHPPATVWLDAKTFETVRLDTQIPLLGGKVTVLRTNRDFAQRPAAKPPELNETQSIPLARAVPNIHARQSVTYRVTLPELPPAEAFKLDSRQEAGPVENGAFDLTVIARRAARLAPPDDLKPVAPEYLGKSFFIDWDTPEVKAHAAQALSGLPAGATDWQKALAIESYVNRSMHAAEFSQAMATCSSVAKSLTGDCTEYAMLGTGLCRAVGIPARTALGLVYAPTRDGKATLAYHMWFEVYINGDWLALDGTLGMGGVGPGHLKITDNSWDKEKSFAPLLPVLAVINSGPKVVISSVR